MDKIQKMILIGVPTSVCNLRCRYCYISQKQENFAETGAQANLQYTPEQWAEALSKKRLGGACYINICGGGETLLTKGISKYIYALAKEGHYIEVVTNCTVTKVINDILSFEQDVLEHITFKCSFHYLQLKERNMLDIFTNNVKNIWRHNCSANIEITPDDELIPYIDEVKQYSLLHYGALPHLSIARDDLNNQNYLTSLTIEEYDKIWSQFDSSFWRFKKEIFNIYRKEYCYAGAWSLYVNMENGRTTQCYRSNYSGNIFENIDKPIDFVAIGKCKESHCYNGHMLLTLGCIPNFTSVRYGDIRDRVRPDGTHWIQPKMLAFLNSKLEETNQFSTKKRKRKDKAKCNLWLIKMFPKRALGKIKRMLKK